MGRAAIRDRGIAASSTSRSCANRDRGVSGYAVDLKILKTGLKVIILVRNRPNISSISLDYFSVKLFIVIIG
jgi:hypothetical protein